MVKNNKNLNFKHIQYYVRISCNFGLWSCSPGHKILVRYYISVHVWFARSKTGFGKKLCIRVATKLPNNLSAGTLGNLKNLEKYQSRFGHTAGPGLAWGNDYLAIFIKNHTKADIKVFLFYQILLIFFTFAKYFVHVCL